MDSNPQGMQEWNEKKNGFKNKRKINEDKGEDEGSPSQKAKKKKTNVEEDKEEDLNTGKAENEGKSIK